MRIDFECECKIPVTSGNCWFIAYGMVDEVKTITVEHSCGRHLRMDAKLFDTNEGPCPDYQDDDDYRRSLTSDMIKTNREYADELSQMIKHSSKKTDKELDF